MSVPNVIQQTGSRTWRITSTPSVSGSTLYRWRDGILVATTRATVWDIELGSGEVGDFVVTDSATEIPEMGLPGRVQFRWLGVDGANQYRIDQYTDGAWVCRGTVTQATNGWYRFESRFLTDGEAYRFRVVGVSADGCDGIPFEVTGVMVRHPDTPDFAVGWNGETNAITVT